MFLSLLMLLLVPLLAWLGVEWAFHRAYSRVIELCDQGAVSFVVYAEGKEITAAATEPAKLAAQRQTVRDVLEANRGNWGWSFVSYKQWLYIRADEMSLNVMPGGNAILNLKLLGEQWVACKSRAPKVSYEEVLARMQAQETAAAAPARAFLVKSYLKVGRAELWLNEEPYALLPGRASFRQISGYPLLAGKNTLTVRVIGGKTPMQAADFEMGQVTGEAYVETDPASYAIHDDQLTVAFDLGAGTEMDATLGEQGGTVTDRQVELCKQATLDFIDYLLTKGSRGKPVEPGAVNTLQLPLTDPAFKLTAQAKALEDVGVLRGRQLVLTRPADLSQDWLVGGKLGELDAGTRFLLWWPQSDGLHLLVNGQWILYSRE